VVKQANLAYRRISSRLAISSPDEFLLYFIAIDEGYNSSPISWVN